MSDPPKRIESGQEPSSKSTLDERKWAADCTFREKELLLKEREQAAKDAEIELREKEHAVSRWTNPLVVGVWVAAVAAGGNAVVAYSNGASERELESERSEHARILEMIKTGSPDKAAENLQFLIDAGLLEDKNVHDKVVAFLANRKTGSGPALPSTSQGAPDVAFAIIGLRQAVYQHLKDLQTQLQDALGVLASQHGHDDGTIHRRIEALQAKLERQKQMLDEVRQLTNEIAASPQRF